MDDLLLLIDGIPAGGAFIPQFEAISLNDVERIEVLWGAAPVYFGTTAFAGTINVILKKDYEGIDLDAQDGISERGDAHNYRIRGLVGRNFMDGRANLTFSA